MLCPQRGGWTDSASRTLLEKPVASVPSLLIIIGPLDVGGAERHLTRVLPGLVGLGWQVEVATIARKGFLAGQLEAAGIKVTGAPLAPLLVLLGRPGGALMAGLTVISLWLRMVIGRPDIVHFYLPLSYIAGGLAAKLAGAPIRVMSRRSLNDYQAKWPRLARLERWLHGSITMALGNCQAVVDQLRGEGIPAARTRLIYNGLDAAELAPSDGARQAMRSQLGLSADTVAFVIVANLIPYKGHGDLIDGLAATAEELPPDWRLLCVGRDAVRIQASLAARAAAKGIGENVLFLGQRNDVSSLLAAADIGVLASHEEGFPNAVLEYMAAGLPVVVTDVGGAPETIEPGVSGLLAPPHAPRDLGEVLARLAGDGKMRQAMGQAGRQRVETAFSIGACVAAHAELYEELLAQRG